GDSVYRNNQNIAAEASARFQAHPLTYASGATIPTFGPSLPTWPGASPPIGSPGQVVNLGGGTAPNVPRSAEPQPMRADPWANIPKAPVPMGVGQSTEQKGTAENRVKARADLSAEFGTLAQEATQRMAYNDQALSLVDKADVGPGSGFLTDIKKVAVTWGAVKESDFENSPTANIALNKDL